MKAEQQNQTETGITAEQPRPADTRIKEGRAKPTPVVGQKGKERSTTWLWVVGFLVVVGLMIWWFLRANARSFDSDLWVQVGDGRVLTYTKTAQGTRTLGPGPVLSQYPNTEQGRVARFQLAWFQLWDLGIKNLGSQSGPQALESVKRAKKEYEELLQEVKSDPLLAPEAMYCIAVATETLAIEDRNLLSEARTAYGKLVEEHPKSAYKDAAEKRHKLLENDASRAEVEAFYVQMGSVIQRWRVNQQAEELLRKKDQEPGKVKGDK